MSTLTITPNLDKKTAKIVGRIAGGEHVDVTLEGCASLNSPTLRLRILFFKKNVARFPMPVDEGETPDTFTVDGDDLICELNLNTIQMVKAMRRFPSLNMMFVLDDPGSDVKQLYFASMHEVQGWPHEAGEDVPVDLDGYVDFIQECDSRISAIQQIVTESVSMLTAAMDLKVDKVPGKGLSTYDLTQSLFDSFAKTTDFNQHVSDAVRHISAQERIAWNAKADAVDMPKKQDVIVQDGYLYVPDRDVAGRWHRMQAYYDSEMEGVTTTCGNDNYVRDSDGTFILEA